MRKVCSQYGCLEVAVGGGIVLGRLELGLCRDGTCRVLSRIGNTKRHARDKLPVFGSAFN